MQNIKILIVEDELLIAQQLKNRLVKLGYQVSDIVTSGDAAVGSLRRNPANLVLMDIVIKGEVDGVETADMVQREFDIPVIFLTAYTDNDTLKRAELTRAYGYLVKPFQERELHAMIRLVLTRHKRDQELLETISVVEELGNALGSTANRLASQVKGCDPNKVTEELQIALDKDQFELHYQPQVSLTTGEIIGAEALVRWNHPVRGFLAPGKFIPEAEKSGLIHEIGEWVLETACRQAEIWLEANARPLKVAVNISSTQIRPHRLVAHLDKTLAACGLPPGNLELEVTESVLMHDRPDEITVLRAIKELGVKLSVDDFGTGYSGLSYLQSFPFDIVKLDRHFVRNITGDAKHVAITRAILKLAKSLEMQTIAEGVENMEELRFLKDHGCDAAQGYLLSPPITADAFTELWQSERRLYPDGNS